MVVRISRSEPELIVMAKIGSECFCRDLNPADLNFIRHLSRSVDMVIDAGFTIILYLCDPIDKALALSRLRHESPQYYAVLRRLLLCEMSHGDIADSLNISKGSVNNRIYRGKQKLIRLLRDEIRDYCHHWDQYAEGLHHLAKVMGTTGSELVASLNVA